MIRFQQVYKQHGSSSLLSNLSFEIKKGETVALMGPSGCGKTTVLRCINGLEQIQGGEIWVRGVNITHPQLGFNWNQFRSSIGVVFQQFNLFPHLTVMQNITLGPTQVKGIPKTEAEEMAYSLLQRVGLSDKANRYPHNLSGGEKQRVAIVRALAMSSDILLLDEPTSALDPFMTAEVLHTLHDLSHQGITMVIVTHEIQFACRAANTILFLHNGQIEAKGPPDHFLHTLDHPVAKRYFELLNDGYPQQAPF